MAIELQTLPPGKSIIFDFSTSLTHLELGILFKPLIMVTINTYHWYVNVKLDSFSTLL